MKKRMFAILLVLVQLLLLMSACTGDENATKGTTAGTTAAGTTAGKAPETTQNQVQGGNTTTPKQEPTTEPPVPEDPYLYLVVDGEPQYEIINSLKADETTVGYVRAFMDDLETLTGATFTLGVESAAPKTEKEILVNAYRNRDEEIGAIGRSVSYTGYRIDVVGERIVLSTYSDYVKKMLDVIFDALEEIEDDCWAVNCDDIVMERDLFSNRTIPVYETVDGAVMGNGTYRNAYDGYTVGIEKTNAEEFAAYLSKLESLGYSKYDENTIGMVDFYTYVNGSASLYVQYNTSDTLKGPSAKMTLTYGETLPATTAPSYEKLVDSSINNLARVPGAGGWGMGMVFQLADGSFVLVDGALNTAADQAALLKFMQDNKPASHTKPVVSCWLWTHPHGDHVDLCVNALANWSSKVEIKTFAYNFIKAEDYEGTGVYDSYQKAVVDRAMRYYPDAAHWIMHAGQRLYVADAVIECIWSHEDVYPTKFIGVNDTDTVFSITIDGVKTMMLGDCENPNSKMISYYKEAMKSPVVQNSHHTLNGPKLMYEYIDPMHSFWACSAGEVAERSKREHAAWLLSTRWTRVDENGVTVEGERSHYNNNQTTRLYVKDLKAAIAGLS